MKRYILFAGLLSILLISCTAATSAPTSIPSTETPQSTSTPTLIPSTATPVQLSLLVTDELVNCRYGPGTIYALVNELREGQSARVVGRSENSTWWYIRDPGNPNGVCWVSASVTQIEGDAKRLPVVSPSAVSITKINLRIEPERINVACNQFPQIIFFESEITANGPALVTWRLESSTGYVSTENILIFEESGMQFANGYYQVPVAGDYWIKIHILKPNDVVEQLNFPANCSP